MLSTIAFTLFLSLSSSTVANAARLPVISVPDGGQTLSRRDALCDGAGYDLGKNAYFYLEDANLATKWGCADHCRADSKCKAFAIGKGACLHYDVNVEDNSRADTNSPWSFFDRTCLVTEPSKFVAPPSVPQTTQPSNPQPAPPAAVTTTSTAANVNTNNDSPKANPNPAPASATTNPVRVITTDAPLSSEFSVPAKGGANAISTTTSSNPSQTGVSQSSNSDGTSSNKGSSSGSSGSGSSSGSGTTTNDASSMFGVSGGGARGLVVSGLVIGLWGLLA